MATPKVKYKKSQDTISCIMQSALRLLETKGFANVTVRDICADAGVSTGSFYTHFESKEQLLGVVFTNPVTSRKDLNPSTFSSGPCKVRIENFVKQYAWMNMSNEPEHLKVILSTQNPIFMEKRHLVNYALEILASGIESGEVNSKFSAEGLADILLVCLRGCSHEWVRQNGNYDLADQMVQCSRLLFSSIWCSSDDKIEG